MIADMLEHEEITVETVKQQGGPGRESTRYTATGSTTRQEPSESTQTAYYGKYPVPSQEARDYSVMMVKGCDPERFDWDTLSELINEAYK